MRPSGEEIEVVVGRLLERRNLSLALAESCTGGLVSHRITNVSGSSAYYRGSIVAYGNIVKRTVLQVGHDTLDRYGAVSDRVALEMAWGARRLFDANVGLAVTGIAGPTGGTPEKPVGLTYVSLAAPDHEQVCRYVWRGNRMENKTRSAEAVLSLLRCYLEGAF